MANATFKAIIKGDGKMVAGLASVVDGKARFFVAQRRESQEEFVGRVSAWLKGVGAEGLQMMPPEALPEGIEVAEVLLRLKHSLGIGRAPEAAEYDVENVEIQVQDDQTSRPKN